jgi:hypothetical protein
MTSPTVNPPVSVILADAGIRAVKAKKAKNAKKRPKADSARTPLDAVTDQLKSYAARGVFREFSARPFGAQRIEYRFVWLTSRPMQAVFDIKINTLRLIDLLPGVAPRSEMDKALREFLAGRFSAALPAHRRLSRTLIRELKATNREESITLHLKLNSRHAGEGAKQAVHLISEIFQNFLAGPYHEYMVRNFDVRED